MKDAHLTEPSDILMTPKRLPETNSSTERSSTSEEALMQRRSHFVRHICLDRAASACSNGRPLFRGVFVSYSRVDNRRAFLSFSPLLILESSPALECVLPDNCADRNKQPARLRRLPLRHASPLRSRLDRPNSARRSSPPLNALTRSSTFGKEMGMTCCLCGRH